MGWQDDPVAPAAPAWQNDPVVAPAAPAAAPAAPTDNSAVNGLSLGLAKPVDNLTSATMSIPGVSAIDKFGTSLGFPSASAAVASNDAARANNSRTGYQTLGKIIGTAPTLAIPGAGVAGMAAQGAAGGLLTSDATNAKDAVGDGLWGALGGVAGGGLLKGAGAMLTPKIAPVISYLDGLGIPTTVGQKLGAAGGWLGNTAKAIEDKLAGTFPIAGTAGY